MKQMPLSIVNWLECIWLADLPSASKLLAAYLRSYMNAKHDIAWPSLSRIEKETGLSLSSCCKYLEILEKEGWIARNRGHGGKINKSTEYLATFPKTVQEALRHTENVLRQTERGTPPDGEGALRETQTNTQYSNTQVNTQERGRAPQKIRMTLEWHPTQDEINAHCARSAKSPSLITPTVLQEFREYWSEEQSYFTHAQWITKLLQSAQRQKATPYAGLKKIVAPIPPNPDKPSDWAVQFCAELEEEKKRDAERSGRCNVQA